MNKINRINILFLMYYKPTFQIFNCNSNIAQNIKNWTHVIGSFFPLINLVASELYFCESNWSFSILEALE